MVTKKVVLRFPNRQVDQPIVYKLVKDYNLQVNILKAQISQEDEGLLILELYGSESNYRNGISYLKRIRVKIQPLAKDIIRNEEKCTHCGVCVSACPTDALSVDMETREIIFKSESCVACEHCVPVCPSQAMELRI